MKKPSTWWNATSSAESFFARADLSRKLFFGSSNHQNCRVPPWGTSTNGDRFREKSGEWWFNGDMSHHPNNFHPNLPTTSPLPSRNQIRGTMKNSASAVQSHSLVLTSRDHGCIFKATWEICLNVPLTKGCHSFLTMMRDSSKQKNIMYHNVKPSLSRIRLSGTEQT